MTSLLWLCFTLSGAAALALEMLWMGSAEHVLDAYALRRQQSSPDLHDSVQRFGCLDPDWANISFMTVSATKTLAWPVNTLP
jgi:hypothetical protein